MLGDGNKGKINILCFCNNTFETTVNSYLNSKNGCPYCKSENFKKNNPNKSLRVSSKSQKKKKEIPLNSIEICSREDLVLFLKNNPNAYNNFIFEKIEEEKSPTFSKQDKNRHHIIPRHTGGPDEPWNILMICTEDHKKAHQIRYEVYAEEGDLNAIRFWNNPPKNTVEAQKRRIKLSHETCKVEGIGFFSSEQQSINGQKGGKVKSENKKATSIKKLTPVVANVLNQKMRWKHKKNVQIEVISIEPGTLQLVADLRMIFVNSLPEGEEKTRLLHMPTANFSSSVSKVLKGQRKTAHNFTLIRD